MPIQFKKKLPYKCISLEKCKGGVEYAFSLNPGKEYVHKLCYLSKYIHLFDKHVGRFAPWLVIEAYPEFSPSGKLHFHGTIKMKIGKELDFYALALPALQMIGIYEIDTIGDRKVWNKYCKKQQPHWKQYKYPINFPITLVKEQPKKTTKKPVIRVREFEEYFGTPGSVAGRE